MYRIDPMLASEAEAVNRFILKVTLPLLLDAEPCPEVLGTGTLFQSEGRTFLVTAAHILKKDPDDPNSDDIDFTAIAFPSRPLDAKLQTLGTFNVHRPAPPSNIDVVVLELKTTDTIEILRIGWGFLDFDKVGSSADGGRFILSGYLFEGAHLDGDTIKQAMLTLWTNPLNFRPDVKHPEPLVDQFYYLQNEGELIDGSTRKIPRLEGMSGASIWSYTAPKTSLLWDRSKALHVVGVQSTFKRGEWFRGVDWAAVKVILRDPKIGLRNPPK